MIPQIEPWLGEDELNELKEVIKNRWITEGEKTRLFEEKIKHICKSKHAISVNNGTIGLYMCLNALGIGQGDEVIVPDLTFIATVNSVLMSGAKPVLADINKRTFNIDPKDIESKITDKTKAIIPVHLYGQSADMVEINRIAKENTLFVIEDAAQGMGVFFNCRHTGILGDIGVLSFYGNKTITTGEGGVILTNDDGLARKCWMLKNHGRTKKGIFIHESVGYNFCFTDLQAAIGIAQLKKLPKILELKKRNQKIYEENLKGLEQIEFPHIDPRCDNVYWFTNILLENPGNLEEFLLENGIQTRRFFYPIHRQPCYNNLNFGNNFPNTEYAYEHGLSLPSSVELKEKEIILICNKIKEFFNK